MSRQHPALRLSVLLLALGAGSAQAGLFDDEEARRQIADLKARSEAYFDTQGKAQLDLSAQIQRQAEEIARLRGQIETLNYELETAKKRQQDFYIDLDNRLRRLEPQGAAPAAGGEAASGETAALPKAPVDPAVEGRDYETALAHLKAGRYKESASGFAAFVQKYPDSALAPNAQFWLGNSWYAQHDCKRAIEAQGVVVSRWPDSPKAPDALLAQATCQQELGNAAGARRTLETLLAKYPNAPAAAQARQRLKK